MELPLEKIITWQKQRKLLITSVVILPAKCAKVMKTEYTWQAFLMMNFQESNQKSVKIQLESFTQTNLSFLLVPCCKLPYGVIQFVLQVAITTRENLIVGKRQVKTSII